MSNLTVFRPLHTASGGKSALRSFYERMGGSSGLSKAKAHALATGAAVRQGAESAFIGAALGAAHVELKNGLDLQVPIGSKTFNVPIDAVAGVVGMAASIGLAQEEYGTDLRNTGAAAIAVFGFRKTFDALAERKRAAGGVPGGKFAGEGQHATQTFSSEDPLLAAARNL